MSIKKKIVWLPYDMDTAIGINNDGQMVFGYELEDIDHQAGGENVFNGQDSVVWKNIRAAFGPELAEMYRSLRSGGNFSYEAVEEAFEEHQSKWSEAIFNEDAEFKYIIPFVQSSANYLAMLLGSKAEQRKWWLYNRFRYIDSKYIAGDARDDTIFLRPYAAADITLTPYADIYATIAWDATITQERAPRNNPVTLECPYESMNGNIVTIYSSSQLAQVGDLSPLKVGQIDISNAVRLQALKIGDEDSDYENTNLYALTFGANVLLKTIDARGCSGLGDTSMTGHTQTTVDISGCSIIEHVYMEGTKIQGITLPNGGVLKTLHLPSTIKNLTILNQPAITSFSVEDNDYSGISTLRLENVSSAIDEKAILRGLTVSATQIPRVRLIGINWECQDATEIDGLLDLLDTMKGLDESGGNVEQAQVSGTIHTTALTGAAIAEFQSRYPYITFSADYVESTLTFKTWDGSATVGTVTCYNGAPQSTIPTPPARTATAQYNYTGVGWNLNQDAQTNDPSCVQNVTADRTVYAAYSRTVRTYTVTFVRSSTDGGGTLQTFNNIAYGTNITAASKYSGSTPTTTQGSATDYPFEGWNPASATVTGNTTFTAKFGSPIDVSEISDTWDQIIAKIDNGTYKTAYKLGQYKPLDLGTEGIINMQIVAMDTDELESGGTAPLTFLGMELLATTRTFSTINWSTNTNIRGYLNDTLLSTIASNVRSRIQTVKKYTRENNNIQTLSNDKLWIPSGKEVGGTGYQEDNAKYYNVFFTDNTSRIKKRYGESTPRSWWLRTYCGRGGTYNYMAGVNSNGVVTDGTSADDRKYSITSSYGICLGFCLGLEPETITDDWATILANQNYATDYSIGDTKYLDLGTEGKHLMEIVAINEDNRADNTGKAGLTWISKTLLNSPHRMNPANNNGAIGTGGNGGWENCEMRTYLKNTIKPLIPATVRDAIVPVTKIQSTVTGGTMVKDGQTTTEDVWIPSNHEIFGTTGYETSGAVYTTKFSGSTSRTKKKNSSADAWWLRSASSSSNFRSVYIYGSDYDFGTAYTSFGVALGFCTN